MIFVAVQCFNQPKAPVQKAVVANPQLVTHKEAVDTLAIDSTAPRKPLIFNKLSAEAMTAFLTQHNLDSLFVEENNYPDNGFYGDDRYRIEFIFTEVKRDEKDPSVYHVKGKNRHKKTVTAFEGTLSFAKLSTFIDPNIDTAEVGEMGLSKLYAAEGTFVFDEEDKTSPYSGQFKGSFKTEFSFRQDNDKPELWYFSEGLPSMGAGYRFDGTWTSFTKPDIVKPVIWAADIFRFANDILKDFSIGERDVEINEQYRSIGWDNFWENEEWWSEAEKPKM
jgi:hypothetical protein